MKYSEYKPKKIMGAFGLVMINVIAVDSLRALPATAQYGFSVIFYYLLAGVLFFIPTALVAGELATGWPKTGGIYIWAKEAFNKEFAFILISLQWLYNVCWYPTILSLMAATLAYCIDPRLSHDTLYMFLTVSGLFWSIVLLNCFGMKSSNYLTYFSSLIGTLIPILFVIILGLIWLLNGKPLQIQLDFKHLLPNLDHLNILAYMTAVVFSLMGMEMSAIHAQEVNNPQKDYPKALLISALLILCSFIFASLSIAMVVPADKLNIVSGLLQAYRSFFAELHMAWMLPVVAILIVIGGAGGVGAWLLGPVKGLLIASKDGLLPKTLSHVNKFNAPSHLIILQGIIFTFLASAFLLMPSVSSGFWILGDLAAQLSLIFYIGLFCVAIRLRYKCPNVNRAFKIPFGNIGMWIIGLSGIFSCLLTIGLGFLPPPHINIGSTIKFESFLLTGIILACLSPYILAKCYSKWCNAKTAHKLALG
jgi:amino acid transporter